MSLIKINNKIHIGDNLSCFYENKEGWVVIHACKYPCYHKSVGRKILNQSHKNYLIKEEENHLYLNIIDNDKFDNRFAEPMIRKAIEFMKNNIKENNILIHCNVGLSRSPSIALVFLAKVSEEISNESYDDAKKDFLKLYPAYQPGLGVDNYLREYWEDLD